LTGFFHRIAPKVLLPERDFSRGKSKSLRQKSLLPSRQMESGMSTRTKNEVMSKLRRRYLIAGREHKKKLIDEAVADFAFGDDIILK
jgi:hypothetical protein